MGLNGDGKTNLEQQTMRDLNRYCHVKITNEEMNYPLDSNPYNIGGYRKSQSIKTKKRKNIKNKKLLTAKGIRKEKARVIQVIDEEKRGYKAVQLGYGKIKNSKLTKAMKGFYAKKNTEAKKKLKEFRVKDTETYKEGNEFGLEIFKDTKFVDTRSKTIGKGFAGAMKRPDSNTK
jgi:ribosomal protein L3